MTTDLGTLGPAVEHTSDGMKQMLRASRGYAGAAVEDIDPTSADNITLGDAERVSVLDGPTWSSAVGLSLVAVSRLETSVDPPAVFWVDARDVGDKSPVTDPSPAATPSGSASADKPAGGGWILVALLVGGALAAAS